jgi:precorrin isomerase
MDTKALPEWITKDEEPCVLIEALAIAWEALEIYKRSKAFNGETVFTVGNLPNVAEDAMRRIEELGK